MKMKASTIHDIKRILVHYGKESQKTKTIEELCELEHAIFGESMGLDTRKHVIEELSDVIVMLEQLKIIYRITDAEIEEVVNFKIRRQIERIKKESEQR